MPPSSSTRGSARTLAPSTGRQPPARAPPPRARCSASTCRRRPPRASGATSTASASNTSAMRTAPTSCGSTAIPPHATSPPRSPTTAADRRAARRAPARSGRSSPPDRAQHKSTRKRRSMSLIPHVDEFACAAHGDCALAAPGVFTVDDIAVVTGAGSDDEDPRRRASLPGRRDHSDRQGDRRAGLPVTSPRPPAQAAGRVRGERAQTALAAAAGCAGFRSAIRSGITVTGQSARWMTSCATLPSSARMRPTPRLPMTISAAS